MLVFSKVAPCQLRNNFQEIHAEVVTFVAGSLEAGGLPGYPEVLVSLK
jgi:hypothetical protein